MIPDVGLLKARRLIDERGPVLVVALGVIAVLSLGGAGWVYAHPPTTTVTDHNDVQHVRSELHTTATVTDRNDLYSVGTVLHDEPTYLFAASPNVTVTLSTSVRGSEDITATQRLELVVEATRNGEPFWRQTLEQSRSRSGGRVGTSASTNLTIDVARVQERLQTIRSTIGQSGRVDVSLRSTVAYETDRYAGEQNKSVPVELSGNGYTIAPFSTERRHSNSLTRVTPLPGRSELRYLIPAGVGALALLAAGVIGASYRRGPDPTAERQLHELRYADWISQGTLAPELGSTRVPVHDLEGLVDVAIDANKRVIHDSERGCYAVLDGDVVYLYDP